MGVLDTLQPIPNQAAATTTTAASQTNGQGTPGWADTMAAAYRSGKDTIAHIQDSRLSDPYEDLAENVAKAQGKDVSAYWSPYSGRGDAFTYGGVIDPGLVWKDIAARRATDPGFLPGVPATQAAFEHPILTRNGAHAQDEAAAGAGSFIPRTLGGLASAVNDPVQDALGLMGGPELPMAARAILGEVGTKLGGAALGNATAAMMQEPGTVAARANIGQQTTAGDVAGDIGGAALFGTVLHGAGMAAGHAAQVGFEHVVPQVWDSLPTALTDAWGARTTFSDPELAARFAAGVAPIDRTPDQQAALHVLDRNNAVEGANPFPDSYAAMALHKQRLGEAMADLDSGRVPGGTPGFAPVPRDPVAPAGDLTPDAIIRFVQGPLEGGSALDRSTMSDGGLSRYGISTRANPGVDVSSLTAEAAHAIAKSKYWFPELDQQSPGMQAVAFDAGYIGGEPFAQKLIAESGGDVSKALDLYREHLNAIADNNPAKDVFRKGWMNRVDKLERFIDRNGGRDATAGALGDAGAEGIDPASGEDMQGIAEAQADAGDTAAPADEGSAPQGASEAPEPAPAAPPAAAPSEAQAPLSVQVLMPGLRKAVADRSISLNRIDALAAAMGAHPDDIRSGLQQLVASGELRQRSDNGNFMRPAPGRDLSLIESIQQNGGIWDGDAGGEFKGGDFAAMGLNDWYKGGPFRSKRPIIRTPEQGHGNRGADNVLRAAIEDGYFPELRGAQDGTGPEDIDTNHLHNAIAEELAGRPRYPVGSRAAELQARGTGRTGNAGIGDKAGETTPGTTPEPAAANVPRQQQILRAGGDVLELAEKMGIAVRDIDPGFLDHAAALMLDHGLTPGDAFVAAVNDFLADVRNDAMDEHGQSAYEEIDHAGTDHLEPFGEDRPGQEDFSGFEPVGSDEAPWHEGADVAGGDSEAQRGAGPQGLEPPAHVDTAAMQGFDDPAGAGIKTLGDAVWHDVRADQADWYRAIQEGQERYNRANGSMWLMPIDQLEDLHDRASIAEGVQLLRALDLIHLPDEGNLRELIHSGNFKWDHVATKIEKLAETQHIDIPEGADRLINPHWGDTLEGSLPMSDDVQEVMKAHLAGGDEDPHQLAAEMGWALRNLDSAKIGDVVAGRGSADAQAAMATLRIGFETMKDNGVSPERIPHEIVAAMVRNGVKASDAAELTQTGLDALKEGGRPKIADNAAPPSPPEIKSLTREPVVPDPAPATGIDKAKGELLNGTGLDKIDPNLAAREAQRLKLAAEAPLRGQNATGQAQDGTMGLGLFDAADTRTFDLGDGQGPRTIAEISAELEGDQAALDTINACLK